MFEPADRLGGVLRTEQLGGQPIDIGAEAFVARRPEVPALLAELGLADRQIGTTGARPLIYSEGAAARVAARHAQRHPDRPVIDDRAGRRHHDSADASTNRSRPFTWRPGADPAVAELVGDRFGDQVVTRSVDPLLAGVYAGSAATIGLRSAVPTLAAALDRGARNLTEAVRAALPPATGGSVFGAIDGGYAVLLDELIRRADFHWAQVGVERLVRQGSGWQLVDDEGGDWHADAVVLAVPAPRLATIVADVAPSAAAAARQITVASTALVALALPGGDAGARSFGRAGGRVRTLARQGDHAVVAANGGRAATSSWCGCRSAGTATTSPAVSATTTCCRGRQTTWRTCSASPPSPFDCRVHRWIDAMPQYGPGHRRPGRRAAGRASAVARGGGWLPGRHRGARLRRDGHAERRRRWSRARVAR